MTALFRGEDLQPSLFVLKLPCVTWVCSKMHGDIARASLQDLEHSALETSHTQATQKRGPDCETL